MEVIHIDRKRIVIMLTIVAMAAMLSSVAFTAYANNTSLTTYSTSAQVSKVPNLFGWGHGGPGRGGYGRNGFVEVSAEYNQTVTNIVESDTDIQNLLSEGYSISQIRPVIRTVVQGDGSVVTKATTAIVLLEKGTTARATAYVDIEQGKVTQIVTLATTVIDKS
jgi:hypothetical protein